VVLVSSDAFPKSTISNFNSPMTIPFLTRLKDCRVSRRWNVVSSAGALSIQSFRRSFLRLVHRPWCIHDVPIQNAQYRYEHFNRGREQTIPRSRDGQKFAVFARGSIETPPSRIFVTSMQVPAHGLFCESLLIISPR
jgi:hypothetical protein